MIEEVYWRLLSVEVGCLNLLSYVRSTSKQPLKLRERRSTFNWIAVWSLSPRIGSNIESKIVKSDCFCFNAEGESPDGSPVTSCHSELTLETGLLHYLLPMSLHPTLKTHVFRRATA